MRRHIQLNRDYGQTYESHRSLRGIINSIWRARSSIQKAVFGEKDTGSCFFFFYWRKVFKFHDSSEKKYSNIISIFDKDIQVLNS